MGGLLVSYASRFSIGSRLAAQALFTIKNIPMSRWRCLGRYGEYQRLQRAESPLTSRPLTPFLARVFIIIIQRCFSRTREGGKEHV